MHLGMRPGVGVGMNLDLLATNGSPTEVSTGAVYLCVKSRKSNLVQ